MSKQIDPNSRESEDFKKLCDEMQKLHEKQPKSRYPKIILPCKIFDELNDQYKKLNQKK